MGHCGKCVPRPGLRPLRTYCSEARENKVQSIPWGLGRWTGALARRQPCWLRFGVHAFTLPVLALVLALVPELELALDCLSTQQSGEPFSCGRTHPQQLILRGARLAGWGLLGGDACSEFVSFGTRSGKRLQIAAANALQAHPAAPLIGWLVNKPCLACWLALAHAGSHWVRQQSCTALPSLKRLLFNIQQ
jgi:hypothetical protein